MSKNVNYNICTVQSDWFNEFRVIVSFVGKIQKQWKVRISGKEKFG